jgi:hypothetical protein
MCVYDNNLCSCCCSIVKLVIYLVTFFVLYRYKLLSFILLPLWLFYGGGCKVLLSEIDVVIYININEIFDVVYQYC